MEVFWHVLSKEPPVPWEDGAQKFQLLFIANEEVDIGDLFDKNDLTENNYLTWEEQVGNEDAPVR